MCLIRAFWHEWQGLLRALAIVGIISAVPSVVAERADPVNVSNSVVHGVLVWSVVAIRSSATDAANDRSYTTASSL
jgi:hypothetical protein